MTNAEEKRKLEDRIKFMYLIHEGRTLTIAREYNRDNNSVTYGYALCCPKDQHNRRIGRRIAINRLETQGSTVSCGDQRAIDASMQAIAKETGFDGRPGYISPADIARLEIVKRTEESGNN